MSQLFVPGRRRIPTPALPNPPTGVGANASVLKLRKNVLSPFDSFGSPITVTRAASVDPLISVFAVVVNVGVKGDPDTKLAIPDTLQRSVSAPIQRLFSRRPGCGRSQVKLTESTCERSKFSGP